MTLSVATGAADEVVVDDLVVDGPRPPDLRMVALAVMAWAGGLLGFLCPMEVTAAVFAAAVSVGWVRWRGGRPVLLLVAWLVAAAAVAGSAAIRVEVLQRSPVTRLADAHAAGQAVVKVTSDPVLKPGTFAPFVVTRGRILQFASSGATYTAGSPVLIIGTADWADVELGSTVTVAGRLAPARSRDLAAVLSAGTPDIVDRPGDVLGAARAVRLGIRAAVAPYAPEARALIPALVAGDDAALPADVVSDFRTSGLTHLAAVSGTNLTLVVGFLLIVARWIGVRARGLVVVGALGVVGFVLLARTEPSVLRAAAMGSVALLGMSSNGREKGTRALGVAVLVLLLIDPWLALSVGFALSALATAGIIFLAPVWRDALRRWLPLWASEAVAVPLAAQLACTPVVAAISGQVSLVAVVANLLVAPAVAPATVLGLLGGLAMLLWAPSGLLMGRVAAWCGQWIIEVAHRTAALPVAAVSWPTSAASIVALTLMCLLIACMLPVVLSRRTRFVALTLVLGLVVLRPLPHRGWPPPGWVMVACDVGQGDGLVLNAGNGVGVVVDAGPDPEAIDGCLDRLHLRALPVVVLTHFHADHIDGLPGVLDGRDVGLLVVTGLDDPPSGAEQVRRTAAGAGVPVEVAHTGDARSVGQLTWQVLGPVRQHSGPSHGEEGSAANNASVVLLASVRGIRIALTGDMEPEAQQSIERTLGSFEVDVLKVPHHGSRYQEPDFLRGLGARLAIISVGAGNDYGHPAAETVALLREAGMAVRRTDQDGDIAVVADGDQMRVTSRGPPG